MEGPIDVTESRISVRKRGLAKQLEAVKDTILGRGWWSYLTDHPVIDTWTILEVTAGWEFGHKLTIAILPAVDPEYREIIIAFVGREDNQVYVNFPLPPGRVSPEILEGFNGA